MCYGIMLNKWVLQTYQPDFMKSPLVYHPGHRAQVWRFFSYMFMHVGYEPPLCRMFISAGLVRLIFGCFFQMLHCGRRTKCYMLSLNLVFFLCCLRSLEQLGFNALLQLMIGVPLEMVHGILRISLLYMAGVLAGECLIILECSIIMESGDS